MNSKFFLAWGWRLICLALAVTCLYLWMELKRKKENLSDLYMSEVSFTCTLGAALADNKSDRVLKALDDDAISHARGISKQYSTHPGAMYWLWKIRAYVTARKIDVPNDVMEIFDRLPKEMPMPEEVYYNKSFE